MNSMTKSGDSQINQSKYAKLAAVFNFDISSEVIICHPFDGLAEYLGTRAALEAEGVIPPETKWPVGFDDLYWHDDQYCYWLRRERPAGVKGPRNQFIDVDWWMFRCDPVVRRPGGELLVERKKKALADEIYRQSEEGRAKYSAMFERYWKAVDDEDYQKFRRLLGVSWRAKAGNSAKSLG